MVEKVAGIRYLSAKLGHTVDYVSKQLASSQITHPEAWSMAWNAWFRKMTTIVCITGAGMAPTFSPKGDEVENLLVRLIPKASAKNVWVEDVIAFKSPFAASALDPGLMVRRVAAMEGEEMASDDPEDVAFRIPQGHCWVLADNEKLSPPHVIDSRTFGPLPLSNVVGRVLYSSRSEVDHGPVENSVAGMMADAPVIEGELDLDLLCRGGREGTRGMGREDKEPRLACYAVHCYAVHCYAMHCSAMLCYAMLSLLVHNVP